MEELLSHFVEHIRLNVSPELSKAISKIIAQAKNSPYEQVEQAIKLCIKGYLSNISEDERGAIAKRLYIGFIQMDDYNIIKSIRLLYRYFSFYHQIKVKQYFCKWRIITLKIPSKTTTNSPSPYKAQDNNLCLSKKTKDKVNTVHITNPNYTKPKKSSNSSINQLINEDNLPEDNKPIMPQSYNNLYSDHHKIIYHKHFTNELKDVTGISQCTFFPNAGYSL